MRCEATGKVQHSSEKQIKEKLRNRSKVKYFRIYFCTKCNYLHTTTTYVTNNKNNIKGKYNRSIKHKKKIFEYEI